MSLKHNLLRQLFLLAAVLCTGLAIGTELRVEVGATRAPGSIFELTDEAVRQHAKRTSELTSDYRATMLRAGYEPVQFSLPLRVVLTQNGIPLPMNRSRGRAPLTDINPVFGSDAARLFDPAYQTLLEDVFASAKTTMNAVFGAPAMGGDVNINSYDADIQDRYAVAGGYYVPNAPSGTPEIRFPQYNAAESAAVNYVHCLLLAYQGYNPYPFDVLNEGLVRAATIKVVTSSGSLPVTLDSQVVRSTLDATYEVGPYYDWYNQPALGGPSFIAPNLLNVQLPAGGSTGGIFLARYKMAGSAWMKVIAERPAFISEINTRYYLNPTAYVSMDDFAVLGQVVLDAIVGGPTGSVEGLNMADWMERQYIMDTSLSAGLKLLVIPIPLPPTAQADFGVFEIDLNAFRTDADGNESLLAETAYPIFWRPDFVRFFTSAQDDLIKLSGGWGAVVPNFPESSFGGDPYRVTVDMPLDGGVQRVHIPAGAVATGTNPSPNNFFGSVIGLPDLSVGRYEIDVSWIGGSANAIIVTNMAFGSDITDSTFDPAQVLTVRVIEIDGIDRTELFSRSVNKSIGSIALNIRPPASHTSYAFTREAKLKMLGVPLQPYRQNPIDAFDQDSGSTLFARWNATTSRYDIFPDQGQVQRGQGFFLRPGSSQALTINGLTEPLTPVSVSLQPGWNMISVPFSQAITTLNIQVTTTTSSLSTYEESRGTILGNTVFQYDPDGVNPDLGTMTPTTSFEPGRAYFIRALQPDGAVLIFSPTLPAAPGGRGPGNYGVALGRPDILPTGWTFEHHRWETQVSARNSNGKTSSVVIGQDSDATPGFDPKFDSPLPPSPGGFQLVIENGAPLYRDFRVWGSHDRYSIVVTGLRTSERCTLELKPAAGKKTVTLIDLETGKSRTFYGSGRYVFNSAGRSHRFEIVTGSQR